MNNMNPYQSVSPVRGADYFGLNAQPRQAKNDLDMETFLRLLVVQLVNQNPLEPMNDRDFFAQMAQLGQVQGMDRIQSTLDLGQSAALIGKTVLAVRPMTAEGSDGLNAYVTGKIVKVSIRNGEQVLGVQEPNGGIVDIRLENIREVAQI